eukprot:gene3277-2259_t
MQPTSATHSVHQQHINQQSNTPIAAISYTTPILKPYAHNGNYHALPPDVSALAHRTIIRVVTVPRSKQHNQFHKDQLTIRVVIHANNYIKHLPHTIYYIPHAHPTTHITQPKPQSYLNHQTIHQATLHILVKKLATYNLHINLPQNHKQQSCQTTCNTRKSKSTIYSDQIAPTTTLINAMHKCMSSSKFNTTRLVGNLKTYRQQNLKKRIPQMRIQPTYQVSISVITTRYVSAPLKLTNKRAAQTYASLTAMITKYSMSHKSTINQQITHVAKLYNTYKNQSNYNLKPSKSLKPHACIIRNQFALPQIYCKSQQTI